MRLALILMAATLAGCAEGPSRSQVLASLVGRPEADVLRTFGAPNRVFQANASKFLAYDDQSFGYAPAAGFGPWGPYGYGWVIPPTVAYARTCETTVEIAGGVMRSWTLRGVC